MSKLNDPTGYYWFQRVPTPRRVRTWQNGHGVYLLERIQRSRSNPTAHWTPYGIYVFQSSLRRPVSERERAAMWREAQRRGVA